MKKTKAESNKRNAKKSTGPKNTTMTRLNATTHGLTSMRVGAHEQKAYDEMLAEYRRSLLPENAVDDFLVRRITFHAFRAEGCSTSAAELMESEAREVIDVKAVKQPSTLDYVKVYLNGGLTRPSLSEVGAELQELTGPLADFLEDGADEVDRQQAVAAVDRLTAALDKLPRKAGSKSWEISEAAERLHRHEVAHENRFLKFLNEYERTKRLRRGDDVPAPVSINITHDINGMIPDPVTH